MKKFDKAYKDALVKKWRRDKAKKPSSEDGITPPSTKSPAIRGSDKPGQVYHDSPI